MGAYKLFIILGIGVIAALGVIVTMNLSKGTFSTQEYEIFVDPFKDEQSMFVMARVTIQNTGNQPLTNVRANFGSGHIEELGTLDPGQKVILSPPTDNPMQFVTVTANEGIFVNKAYRTSAKMPGMMGS